jgi:hypothetical protein
MQILTAAEMAAVTTSHVRHENYGELGRRVYAAYGDCSMMVQFMDAMDDRATITPTVHNLGWTFNTPLPDASLFNDIPLQNRLLPGSLVLPDDTPVNFQRMIQVW